MPIARKVISWFTRSGFSPDGRAPVEAIFLRAIGLVYLVVFIVATATTRPYPSLHGKGLAVTIAMVGLVVSAVGTQPQSGTMATRRRVALLLTVTACSAVLAGLQPKGIWEAGPYFVGIIAAMRLERRAAVLTLAVALAAPVAVSLSTSNGNGAASVVFGAVPWFLVMRLMRHTRIQHDELKASQAAEARAAAEAERGRLAREMHDVLAHSLSALALQLESTRLLARDRDTDPDVTRAIDQAHHLAAGGLDEARRAIAAARGDELPGPERLEALAEAFAQQSGVPTSFETHGDARELPSDARLAIYRTAQEALTNVRKHATAVSVDVQLDYRLDATVLVVEDRSAPGTPPPTALSGTGGGFGLAGMRERAELLGGRLIAGPTSDGFQVELWLPAQQGATAPAPIPTAAPSR